MTPSIPKDSAVEVALTITGDPTALSLLQALAPTLEGLYSLSMTRRGEAVLHVSQGCLNDALHMLNHPDLATRVTLQQQTPRFAELQ